MEYKSEIEKLLQELKGMSSQTRNSPENNSDTWRAIRAKDWASAGFEDENAAKEWISQNPYAY